MALRRLFCSGVFFELMAWAPVFRTYWLIYQGIGARRREVVLRLTLGLIWKQCIISPFIAHKIYPPLICDFTVFELNKIYKMSIKVMRLNKYLKKVKVYIQAQADYFNPVPRVLCQFILIIENFPQNMIIDHLLTCLSIVTRRILCAFSP